MEIDNISDKGIIEIEFTIGDLKLMIEKGKSPTFNFQFSDEDLEEFIKLLKEGEGLLIIQPFITT